MPESRRSPFPPLESPCRRRRLAESAVAAVDVCDCGVMQVHVGTLTLRLEPRAARELAATLDAALTRHAEGPELDPAASLSASLGSNKRRGLA